jgi:integrase
LQDKGLQAVVAGVTTTEDTMTNHLLKRGATYSIRRKVPADLVDHLKRREIVRSLGTKDPAEARRRVREASVQIDREFDEARAAMNGTTSARPPFQFKASIAYDEMMATGGQDELDRLNLEDENRAERFFDTYGVERADMLTAVKAVGTIPTTPRPTAPVPQPATQTPTALSLAALVERWATERKPTGGAVEQMNLVATRFYEHVGRIPIATITRHHAVTLKDKLLASGLAASSVNRYMGLFFTLMKYAHDNSLIPNQLARVPVVVKRTEKARISFSAAAVSAIFTSPVYTDPGYRPNRGAGEAAYWVPLLGLFTGGRLEELCQLATDDVYIEDEHWCVRFVVNTERGQRVKNAGSVRRIPLHPELIRLGFVRYVESRRGESRLFDLPRNRHGRVGPGWSKWFGEYLRNVCKVSDTRMTFHSFRHGWKDAARAAGVARDVMDAYQGHSDGSASSGYGSEFYPLQPLIEAIGRITFTGFPLV